MVTGGNYWTYERAMKLLGVSRRTLQRWMDDMNVQPLVFEGHKKVFLTRLHVDALVDFRIVMRSTNKGLPDAYRQAVDEEDWAKASKILSKAKKAGESKV